MHLNGGSEFSELHYEIFADGKPTRITRHTFTDGSPRYVKKADVLRYGEDEFDILATRGVGMQEWMEAHTIKLSEPPSKG